MDNDRARNNLDCLKMLFYLRKNDRIKIYQLMQEFNVSEKTIRRWAKLLINLNYKIDVKGGRNGGYKLVENTLTIDEWLRIKDFDINIYNKLSNMLIYRV